VVEFNIFKEWEEGKKGGREEGEEEGGREGELMKDTYGTIFLKKERKGEGSDLSV
jgi:hypothetical protein